MADFGPGSKYAAGTLQGYTALMRRLAAAKGGAIDAGLMQSLAQQANREQKALLYTEAVTRRTGHSGQLITIEGVTATSALTVARGTAAWADTGTRPHVITPKVASVLAWAAGQPGGAFRRLTGSPRKGTTSANMTFAMIVHHPGTKPHPYMLRGAQMAVSKSGLVERIVAAWNGAA
jgi:hypothetical protein